MADRGRRRRETSTSTERAPGELAGGPIVNRGGRAWANDRPAAADRRAIGRRCTLAAALLAALPFTLAAPPAQAQRMLVVASTDSPAYRQALAGIQRQAAKLPIEVRPIATDNVDELNGALASAGRGTVL